MKIFFSTVENNQLIEKSINELKDSTEVKGLSFLFDLATTSRVEAHKKWNSYVAIS